MSIEQARADLAAHRKIVAMAESNRATAEAKVVAYELLAFMEKHKTEPSGFTWWAGEEYNDEGYDDIVRISAVYEKDDGYNDYLSDDLCDLAYTVSEGALDILSGGSEEFSVADLRAFVA